MTDGQFKALLFARDIAPLNYDAMSRWNYAHRARLPCTGGALKILIRSVEAHGWTTNGAINEIGAEALQARESELADEIDHDLG
jgi:hypothetical protein